MIIGYQSLIIKHEIEAIALHHVSIRFLLILRIFKTKSCLLKTQY